MLVLVTNDDGILAPGLQMLIHTLAQQGYSYEVVAPETNQSGKSQSITVSGLLPVRSFEYEGQKHHAVAGTPADCLRLVMAGYLPQRPDLVVSGVNDGLNLGPDIYVSGTVGAARMAALHQIPAIALSAESLSQARLLLPSYLTRVMKMAISWRGSVLNVNFPRENGHTFQMTNLLDTWHEKAETISRTPSHQLVQIHRFSDESRPLSSDQQAISMGYTSMSRLPCEPNLQQASWVSADDSNPDAIGGSPDAISYSSYLRSAYRK